VAEHAGVPAVGQHKRGQRTHKGRFAGSVLAQDRDALTARDRERDVAQRGHRAPPPAMAACELLLEIRYFDS